MSDDVRCDRCGTHLPPGADPPGCPRCLIEIGLEAADDAAGGDSAARPADPGFADLSARFPDLEIVREIGRGGMGIVYEARQTRLDRPVALKLVAPALSEDPSFGERFTREARAMARLSHPNIVAVFDFGERDGRFYLVMEYVDGTNLRHALAAGHLAPEQALAIVPRVCDALQYAHDKGVVHRDIKPENVLIDRDGQVKIADFGLAKIAGTDARGATLTQAGTVMGTPQYMAPEQIEAPHEVDHRADIYSLGVVFYEMLTGELPIGRFAPPSRKVQVDVRLDEVVLKSLEKERDLRYQQASEVRTEVESLGTREPGIASGEGRAAPGAGGVRPERAAAFAGPRGDADGVGTLPGPLPGAPAARSGSAGSASARIADDVPGAKGTPRRLSRLAVTGAVFAGLKIVLALWMGYFFVGAFMRMPDGARARLPDFSAIGFAELVLLLPGLVTGLAALGFSIAACVAIARSRGRLYGLWLAVPSLLVGLFCYSPALFPLYLLLLSGRMQ